MSSSILEQVVGTVAAGVLAVAAVLGQPSPASPSASSTRDPLADAVEGQLRSQGPLTSVPGTGTTGVDISWPNCPTGMGIAARRTLGKPLPGPGARYVIIGLTNGPGFHPNPCLGDQVAYVRALHRWTAAYAVVTYPVPAELQAYAAAGPRAADSRSGRLYNTGWAQATANVARMRHAGLRSPILWLDVEPVRPPTPWSSSTRDNRTVLEGSMAAYRQAGLRLGVYSTTYLWRSIVGDARYGLPEWRPAGPTGRAAALELCGRGDVQGGDPVLVQWSSTDVDTDALCPGRPAEDVLREYFAAP